MARATVGLILLVVLAVVVEGPPPPEGRLQSRAGVSNLLRQLFQDLQQDPETPLANLKSQGTGWGVLSRQFGQTIQTGSDDEKTFDCECHIVDAWRDPWCAYLCHQAIIG
ncbi:uncharacterized protein [Branchiostoma lanceolatum]|uniref:uncharacterized protein n=1 Tax=Branchiostoma lanceolatum TaxID=7740 RepID=UPI003451DF3B